MANGKVLRGFKRNRTIQPTDAGEVQSVDGTVEQSELESAVDINTSVVATESTDEPIDPATLAGGDSGDEQPRKRRGRKPGSKNRATQKETSDNLAATIFGAHVLLSSFIAPELAITEENAEKMGDAIAELKRHYPNIEVAEKTLAWMNFIMVIGGVEGRCLMNFYNRVKEEKRRTIDSSIEIVK